MAAKQRERSGGFPPGRPGTEGQSTPARQPAGIETPQQITMREETKAMSTSELQAQAQHRRAPDGVTVIGEAVRRLAPENAEFLVEITTSASNAAQALRDNHQRATQLTQAVAQFGVQPSDLQSISLNVASLYAPMLQGYGNVAQIGGGGFQSYTTGPVMQPALQPEIQFGAYHARNTLRVNVREPGRVGEIVDAVVR